ncbi:MAG TPA: MacB family efflux pump subunit [Micavibrio sp.]
MNDKPINHKLLELAHISRFYQSGDTQVRALDDINLSIYQGEFVAIMGQSGSGKSTLMNIIGCLDQPSAGRYIVCGREASQMQPDELAALRSQSFGFIFQRYNLLATASAAENVEIPALYAGMKREARSARAQMLLEKLGLGARGGHRPAQLSGGQQQRVAIARALMNNPPVILADEPTGALDSRSGQDVMTLLKELHEEGRTIILITHDEKVAQHARRIIRIQDGKIIEDSGTQPLAAHTNPPHFDARSGDRLAEADAKAEVKAEAGEAVRTAIRALHANIFRTALTLLGIVIGVAAVIIMLAVGNGSKQSVLDQISAMGTNILNIRPGAPGIRASGDIATMTMDDATALESLPNVGVVVAERGGRKTLRFGNTDYATSVQGVSAGFPIARDWPIAQGTFFNARDVESYAPVIVLGETVRQTLFGDEGGIGQYVLVGNIPFQVIGVMGVKGAAPWGGDQDDAAYVPISTGLIRLFGTNYLSSITVKITSTAGIEATEAAIRQTLIARHGKEDFSVRNTASFLEMATATQNTLTMLLGAVAAISLLVGGIGVMNIMLVSVTERTREIGIRMATGARRRDIMLQFSTEAAVVCTIGGLMGLAIGFSVGTALTLFDVKVLFSPGPAILAFACAVGTGLLFGYLPARKASRMDPVVALSSE